MEIPVRYYGNNMVFGKDVWAYYKIGLRYQDHSSEEEKKRNNEEIAKLFSIVNADDIHILIFPKDMELEKKTSNWMNSNKSNLLEIAHAYTKDVLEALRERNMNFLDWEFYVGIKLKRASYQDLSWKRIKYYIKEVFLEVVQMITPEGYFLPEEAYEKAQNDEKRLYNILKKQLKIKKVTNREMQYLIERNIIRGNPNRRGEVKPTYSVKRNKKLVEGCDIKHLVNGNIEPHLDYLKIGAKNNPTYITFLTVSYLPDENPMANAEFFYYLQDLEFPVEVSIRFCVKETKKALKTIRETSRGIHAEIRFAEENGERPSYEVEEAAEKLHENEYYVKKNRVAFLETYIVFCITADSKEKLNEYYETLKTEYSDVFDWVLERPLGDQLKLYTEFFPGAEIKVKDYKQMVEPRFVSSGGIGITRKLGTDTGFYIGTTIDGLYPVFIDPSLGAQNIEGSKVNNLSIAITGETGFGKSRFINQLCYIIGHNGGRIFLKDPKSERSHWKEKLPELADEINIITLSSDERYRGVLDPFYILPVKEAELLALSILAYLLDLFVRDKEFNKLSKGIKETIEKGNPNMSNIITCLKESSDKVQQELGERLEIFQDISFAILLFGDEKPQIGFEMEAAINIMQIQNLALPKKNIPKEKYKIENILSEAIMKSISAWERKFLQSDSGTYKLVVSEEAWNDLDTFEGEKNANSGVKEGRALNTGSVFVLQNVKELGDSSIRNNIGLKFAFKTQDREETLAVLEFFSLKHTEENITLLESLSTGCCLFQDIYGRTGAIYMDIVFEELAEVFDSRPSSMNGG
jgi:Domain of unknown function DUF87.